jgi:Leucine-rich repeat (LRR) protein
MNFPKLRDFDCSNNKLVSLPENMNLPIDIFDCSNNKLVSLPENMNYSNLYDFDCSNNKLVSLPVCILNFRNINYCNNMIELSP